MALIKCPECGRENVSDSATSCPNCGYGIKEYFAEIEKKKEAERIRLENEKRKKYAEAEEKARFYERVKQIQKPQKPEKCVISIPLLIFAVSLSLFAILVIFPTFYGFYFLGVERIRDFGIFFLIISVFIYVFIFLDYKDRKLKYSKEMERYKLAQKDFAAYQRLIIVEQDKKQQQDIVNKNLEKVREESNGNTDMENDIHTIRNIMMFYLIVSIIGLVIAFIGFMSILL